MTLPKPLRKDDLYEITQEVIEYGFPEEGDTENCGYCKQTIRKGDEVFYGVNPHDVFCSRDCGEAMIDVENNRSALAMTM